jgi:heme exporter protein B
LENRIYKHLKKDILVEFRNRSAVNISFAFAGITTIAVSLASGGIRLDANIQSILFWIIIFFSGMSGLAHTFIREEEERTALFLAIHSIPEEVYISKLLFNLVFFIFIALVVSPLYIFFMHAIPVHFTHFCLTVLFGSIAIASVSTILGAIVSKAENRGTLFTVISFPLMLPVLWIAIMNTTASLEPGAAPGFQSILFLLAFSGVIISASYLSFKFIWME